MVKLNEIPFEHLRVGDRVSWQVKGLPVPGIISDIAPAEDITFVNSQNVITFDFGEQLPIKPKLPHKGTCFIDYLEKI